MSNKTIDEHKFRKPSVWYDIREKIVLFIAEMLDVNVESPLSDRESPYKSGKYLLFFNRFDLERDGISYEEWSKIVDDEDYDEDY